MRVFIVGSNGYIGSNLVRYLSSERFDVIAGSRSVISNEARIENVQYVQLDLNETITYKKSLAECDIIVYLAGPGALLRQQSIGKLFQEHLVTFSGFLEENSRTNNVPIIFSSSGGTIYGRGNRIPFKEVDPLEPINAYGLLKLMSEELLEHFHRNSNLKYVSMRISNPYGGINHNKVDQGVINIFIKQFFANKPVEIWGDGSSVRDFIYINDLMTAFESCIKSSCHLGAVNIGGGIGTSLSEICALIESHSGSELLKIYKQSTSLLVDYSVLDISAAKDILGWNPVYSVTDGIGQTLSRDLYQP